MEQEEITKVLAVLSDMLEKSMKVPKDMLHFLQEKQPKGGSVEDEGGET